jgi:multiple sugar transport system ATP-binding protein
MASLTFDRVGKIYADGTHAVANTSFQIDDGEFVVLVGPSGCGKSTLLRIAAGLEKLDTGRVLLGEDDVTRATPQDRDIAMIFQSYALYPHMSVYENMAFGLKQRRTPVDEIRRRVLESARILDLLPLLERKPHALSGGQRQRVAMGRAIVRHPAAFLMDEPLSNLDAKLRVQMRAELKLLNTRLAATTLYVTHDQVEAMTMGDRVAILKPVSDTRLSNLQQFDTPQALYDRPVNTFVAGFIGSPAMNFIKVILHERAGTLEADVAGTDISFTVPPETLCRRPHLPSYVGREVIVGFRPEAFRANTDGEEAGGFAVNAQILVTESLGSDSYLFFNLLTAEASGAKHQESGFAGTHLTARIAPEYAPRRGETIRLVVDRLKLYWFDAVTSIAIA